MNSEKPEQTDVNKAGPGSDSGTQLTRGRSGPVRYEIVSRQGHISPVKFTSASEAAGHAKVLWPDQEQDPERTGKGWDVQVVGS